MIRGGGKMPSLIECPACKAQVSSEAVSCPHCGHPFSGTKHTAQVKVKKQTSGCAVVIAVVFGVFVFAILAGSLHNSVAPNANSSSPVAADTTPTIPTWMYDAPIDSISGQRSQVATVDSTNTLEFGFPYQGPQHGTLLVATYPRQGHQIRLIIERGQFICHRFDNCTVDVRFDSDDAITMLASEPDDGDTTTIFIDDEEQFVRHLMKAKDVQIEATYYKEGNQVLKFHTMGFDAKRAGY